MWERDSKGVICECKREEMSAEYVQCETQLCGEFLTFCAPVPMNRNRVFRLQRGNIRISDDIPEHFWAQCYGIVIFLASKIVKDFDANYFSISKLWKLTYQYMPKDWYNS